MATAAVTMSQSARAARTSPVTMAATMAAMVRIPRLQMQACFARALLHTIAVWLCSSELASRCAIAAHPTRCTCKPHACTRTEATTAAHSTRRCQARDRVQTSATPSHPSLRRHQSRRPRHRHQSRHRRRRRAPPVVTMKRTAAHVRSLFFVLSQIAPSIVRCCRACFLISCPFPLGWQQACR